MDVSQTLTLAMQYRSRRSAFFASTVQAVSDTIFYVLFLLAVAHGFWQNNYLLTINRYKNQTRQIIISKYGILVYVFPGILDMVRDSTPKNAGWNAFGNLG